ncbi:hypothetical protein ACRAQ7_12695 [Erythrobacter sp. W53]|uniref:hypothetical protein n=1 Tax=Erythrobacter sp. W53 TaxID=3425947 RepID=UPI003D76712E
MKVGIFRKTAMTMASAAVLATPSIAAAQECVVQDDIKDGVVYAMPMLLDGFEAKCSEQLSSDGFAAQKGAALKERFVTLQDDAWPGTFRVIGQFAERGRAPGGKKSNNFVESLETLPEDAVRPFVDALVTQEITKVIPHKECANIERGLELMEPLPPENWGGLAALLFQLAGVKNPSICSPDID